MEPASANVRKRLICGNWKMNHTHFEAVKTIQDMMASLSDEELMRVDVVVHPPFTDLRSVQTVLETERFGVFLGAQHCYFEEKGAFTGEISPMMLSKLSVSYVIVGHSERRQLFGQSDEIVRKTLLSVAGSGMTPILCVGETLLDRESSQQNDIVCSQVEKAFNKVSSSIVSKMAIAYEPIWAIGTGKTATKEDASEMALVIRDKVEQIQGREVADSLRILYGGSVNEDNCLSFLRDVNIDGLLVGGASLDGKKFSAIVKKAQK